jgi:thiamine pyrophosphokinase
VDAPRTAIVLAGGDPVEPEQLTALPRAQLVVAADGGIALAAPLGLTVDLIVGDLDSADATLIDTAVAAGTEVSRHPVDKDATDLELALLAARARGAARIIVVGGNGGRLDHLLANALLAGLDALGDIQLEWWTGRDRAFAVRDRLDLTGTPGDLVSLLPIAGVVTGVATTGLHWSLDRETLPPGTSRGMSNRLAGDRASIVVESGVLLVVHRTEEAESR